MLQRIVDPLSPNMTATRLPLVDDVKTGIVVPAARPTPNPLTASAWTALPLKFSPSMVVCRSHYLYLIVLERYAQPFRLLSHRPSFRCRRLEGKRAADKDFEKDPIGLPVWRRSVLTSVDRSNRHYLTFPSRTHSEADCE